MALSLTLNGTTTTTIPGAPGNGDRIAMSNGTLRVSFTYNTHSGAHWNADLIEYSGDGGTTWTSLLYGRDNPRISLPGTGESAAGNGALSIITNTAGTLKLQLLATTTVTNTYTLTITYTMTTAQPNCEVSQYVSSSAQLALGGGQSFEDYGACWWSPGLSTSVLALFDGICSSWGATRTKPALYSGNLLSSGRQYASAGNTSRGYGGGMAMLLATGHIVSFVVSPLSAQNAFLNIKDPNTGTPNVQHQWQNCFRSYISWFKGADAAYQGIHDYTPTFVRPGTKFTNAAASTFPQSASTTDATTTLNLTWSIAVDLPIQTGGSSGLPIPRYLLPQRINYWQDTLYPRPNVGGTGILGGGSGPFWQPLATLEATITPLLLHTYVTYYDATYGYWQHDGSATLKESITSAYAMQAVLRWANLGVGNADALTMADQLAVVLANYQTQSGVQKGAFQKVRDTTNNVFKCQEANHAANADQPHISMYCMAECLLALIEYYRVRGNQTLAATYGNITVATLLDQAMAYLILVQQPDGGWLVEYNNTNVPTATNPNGGATYAGSATVDLAASLYQWGALSPTASAANKATWQAQALRAVQYQMLSESVSHGNYEFGEGYITWSHHGTKQLVRGFARFYRLLGSPQYQEWMAYYFDCALLLCKKADDVVNNTNTNSKDVHTGGLISTIDWNGVDSGEASCDWAIFMTDLAALYPGGLLAHHYFFMWANIAHETWGYRDVATYNASYFSSYAYCSPGTNYAGNVYGLDNTRFLYFMASGALMLLPTRTAVACDNANTISMCLEANLATDTPAGRTILLYNPQSTSQVVNLTVRGQAGKGAKQDGTLISGRASGTDMLIGPLTLTAGQISQVAVR